jgi:hypothetical protein
MALVAAHCRANHDSRCNCTGTVTYLRVVLGTVAIPSELNTLRMALTRSVTGSILTDPTPRRAADALRRKVGAGRLDSVAL